MAEFNQGLVDEYFHNWIGISTYNTEDYTKGPSVFGLYFPDRDTAISVYVFLDEWQRWEGHLPMILSVVEESPKIYSFYIYKIGRKEFVKGQFSQNLDIPSLKEFLKNELGRRFVIIARFPDNDNNIIDNPTTKVITFDKLKFSKRIDISESQVEARSTS